MATPEIKPDDWSNELQRFVDPESGAETICSMWDVPLIYQNDEEDET